MEKCGAIFPITFTDCGGIFPALNFSGQKFSRTKPPPPTLYGNILLCGPREGNDHVATLIPLCFGDPGMARVLSPLLSTLVQVEGCGALSFGTRNVSYMCIRSPLSFTCWVISYRFCPNEFYQLGRILLHFWLQVRYPPTPPL